MFMGVYSAENTDKRRASVILFQRSYLVLIRHVVKYPLGPTSLLFADPSPAGCLHGFDGQGSGPRNLRFFKILIIRGFHIMKQR
jgi:hypothetical protein